MTQKPKDTWSAWKECVRHRQVFLVVSVMALLAAIVVSASIPDEYPAYIKISDERKETDILLGLNNFSAWARGAIDQRKGLRMPEVYAQTVRTREFAQEMSKVKIEGYHTDYYHYLLEHHHSPWWEDIFSSLFDNGDEHERILDLIQNNIQSKASSIYNTTLLQVTDQDPVVATILADTVCMRLEQRLIQYQRRRATRDLAHANDRTAQAEKRFKKAQKEYIEYSDSHADITSPAAQAKEDHLFDEYEAAFSSYNKEIELLRRAQALVQKRPSTFAILNHATVPVKKSRPATFGYMLSFLFISLTLTLWIVLGKRKYKEYRMNHTLASEWKS